MGGGRRSAYGVFIRHGFVSQLGFQKKKLLVFKTKRDEFSIHNILRAVVEIRRTKMEMDAPRKGWLRSAGGRAQRLHPDDFHLYRERVISLTQSRALIRQYFNDVRACRYRLL